MDVKRTQAGGYTYSLKDEDPSQPDSQRHSGSEKPDLAVSSGPSKSLQHALESEGKPAFAGKGQRPAALDTKKRQFTLGSDDPITKLAGRAFDAGARLQTEMLSKEARARGQDRLDERTKQVYLALTDRRFLDNKLRTGQQLTMEESARYKEHRDVDKPEVFDLLRRNCLDALPTKSLVKSEREFSSKFQDEMRSSLDGALSWWHFETYSWDGLNSVPENVWMHAGTLTEELWDHPGRNRLDDRGESTMPPYVGRVMRIDLPAISESDLLEQPVYQRLRNFFPAAKITFGKALVASDCIVS